MREIVTEELLKKIENRFLLSIVAAKRARQIKDGAVPLVEAKPEDSELMVALCEIMDDKISAEVVGEEEALAAMKVIEKKSK
jgi:DNA-directed RNA polymerase subunit omega